MNDISDFQKDAIAEMLNIGMGAAAASLSEMVNQEVLLSVPYVEFMNQGTAFEQIKNTVGENFKAVKEEFDGAFGGDAFLFFSDSHSKELVKILIDKDSLPEDLYEEMEKEVLTEIGNIVLNACLGSLADIFGKELELKIPEFMQGDFETVVSSDKIPVNANDVVLLLNMQFSLKEKDVSGFISLLMAVDSAKALTNEITEAFGVG
ncbi:MAG: hypothetical protein COA86_09205 [Kangiella sp.]|nr:MAG: hypothetical protein COA86_09205 [Kangiella sp.]